MTYRSGALLVVLAASLWSLMGLAIRQIDEAGTWAVLLWRSAGAIPVLGAWIVVTSGGRPMAQIAATGWAGVVGGLSLVAAFAGAIYAIQSTTVANAVFLFSASPFLAALLGWLVLREPVRPATWAAIGLAGIGMYVMVREGLAAGALAGNLAALGSALGFAAFTVALRAGRVAQAMPVSFLGCVFSLGVAAAVLALTGQDAVPPVQDIAISAAMGAGILAVGMVLYTLGSRALPAAEATLLSLVEVMLAPVWVWLVLDETATAATFAGGAVVLVAVVLNAAAGARRMVRA
ncbi:DMT family transporter [Rhodobacter sp. Har01]|uniref:DMT family transporter n=1 Tax=Rhodobacter sp. Har01 TaxID=2883999 RepID=UPI001D0807C1|nr:DMT family transporter [Rhodobacter sp. Har01]MCB6178439.1 DMT family transporter [Rhodobacter sp. Har01]